MTTDSRIHRVVLWLLRRYSAAMRRMNSAMLSFSIRAAELILLMVIAIVFNPMIGKRYPQQAQLNTRSKVSRPRPEKVTHQLQDIQEV